MKNVNSQDTVKTKTAEDVPKIQFRRDQKYHLKADE